MLSLLRRVGADDARVSLQWSADLVTWYESDLTLIGSEPLRWQEGEFVSQRFYRAVLELNIP